MPHIPSPQERRALGQSRRKQVHRQDHARWDPKLRTYDQLALVEESMRGRVPSLIPLKYQLMEASPFGFFRGAVPIMAADLALLPHTGIVNQICGDAHVRNLGAYAAPDGRLVFDINDFDETTKGPFEWDLKRLATSLVLAGIEVGSKASQREPAVLGLVASYRQMIGLLAKLPVIDAARYQVHRLQRVQPVSKVLLKAERATPLRNLEMLTVPATGSSRFKGARIFKEDKPMLGRVTGA